MKLTASLFLLLALTATAASADTVTLNTGRKLKGIVTSPDEDAQVTLEVGSGTIILSRVEVIRIERSDAEQQESMRSQWAEKKISAEMEFQKGTAQERLRDDVAPKMEALKPKQASLRSRNGYLFVDASLNNGAKTEFLLDTGAPTVMLTREAGRQLGLLEGDGVQGEVHVAGKTLPVRYVKIPRMEVEGFWATQVLALVYLEDPGPQVGDPLGQNILGMSFLENFHFEINVKRAQLTLSWEEI